MTWEEVENIVFWQKNPSVYLDVFIFGSIYAPIGVFLSIKNEFYRSLVFHPILLFTIYCTLIILSFSFCEIIFKTTFGKKAFKLVIASISGNELKYFQLLVRNVFRILDHMLFPGLVVVLFTKNRQRIGDILSKTVVVMKS